MAIAPTMQALRPNLGLSYFKNQDYREAIAMFGPLLKENPRDERLNLLTGMSHYGLGEYQAATPFLQIAAAQDEQNLTLLLTLAHSCLFAKQFPCVLDSYHKMVALNAESAEADILAGEALDEMHEDVAATREFEAAAKQNPKEPNVHFGLGYLRWKHGQYTQAAPEFEAELANEPQHAQAMRYLGNCYLQMNRLDDAQATLKKAIRIEPANGMEHRDLGFVYSEQGHNEDALHELQEAVRLAPKDVSIHYRLGRLYRTMGKNAEAKAELATAATLNKEADEGLIKAMSMAPAKRGDAGQSVK
jgi:tetratricopeptide (TPR) repeat protein